MPTIALIPCSKTKAPDDGDIPAWLRYLPSPSFRATFETALQTADHVLIVSGKFGLIQPRTPIPWYEAHISKAPRDLAEGVAAMLRSLHARYEIQSHLPTDYRAALVGVKHEQMTNGNIFELAQARKKPTGALTGSSLPIASTTTWCVRNSGATLEELRDYINGRYEHPVTRACQLTRVFKSGYFRKDGEHFFYENNHPCDLPSISF